MYHYDPETALIELKEEGLLPNAVNMRDMVFRARLSTDDSIEVNRRLQEYMEHYGAALEKGREILEQLAATSRSTHAGH